MKFFQKYKNICVVVGAFLFLAIFFAVMPMVFSDHYVAGQNASLAKAMSGMFSNTSPASTTSPVATSTTPTFTATHVAPPTVIKGIYMTSWVAGTPSLRAVLVALASSTEINAVVIDIKDYSGNITFNIDDNPTLKAYGSESVRVADMPQFIAQLHSKGIYVIARVAVFQDAYFVKYRPDLAVKNLAGTKTWADDKGISWIDPGSQEYWAYIAMIAKEAYATGFDEVNFDYVRYPSDGDLHDISFPESSTTPKATVIKNFFAYLHDNLVGDTATDTSRLRISADLFGMTTTADDDMGIGQVLVNALPYFDYVDPMVYPSHYATMFMGYKNPEQYPYQVVQYAMKSAVDRETALASSTAAAEGVPVSQVHLAVLRPWLQDFGLTMDYTAADVRDQIQATYADGLTSWLLWSASNKYTIGALDAK